MIQYLPPYHHHYPDCNPVLPTVYSDSLSYYEEICKLSKKIDDFIDTFTNKMNETISIVNQYSDKVDQAIITINNAIASIPGQIEDNVNAKLPGMVQTEVNKQLTELNIPGMVRTEVASQITALDIPGQIQTTVNNETTVQLNQKLPPAVEEEVRKQLTTADLPGQVKTEVTTQLENLQIPDLIEREVADQIHAEGFGNLAYKDRVNGAVTSVGTVSLTKSESQTTASVANLVQNGTPGSITKSVNNSILAITITPTTVATFEPKIVMATHSVNYTAEYTGQAQQFVAS